MLKKLIEYKGIPGIISYFGKTIKHLKYIVAYSIGQNEYCRKDFNNLDDAIDFTTDDLTSKLVFIELTSIDGNNTQRVQQKYIFVNDNKLNVTNEIEFIGEFKNLITFNIDFIKFQKTFKDKDYYDSTALKKCGSSFDFYRFVKESKMGTIEGIYFQLFTGLFPRFNDLYKEVLFLYNVISRNEALVYKEEIEAYLLQAKQIVENNKKNPFIETNRHKSLINKQNKTNCDQKLNLMNLIGLSKIKLEIEELQALAYLRKKRLECSLPVTPSSLHMVFTGNPGTGKTTVARLLGQIYYDIGLLSSNNVVEVSRGDLVGEYVGHTSPKTQKVFNSALGGILFIDEAYSLFKTGKDFGSEAVETLLKLMEDNRENVVVILAGYPKEIDDLLNSNPGLKSRFSKTLHFYDYSKEELMQIFCKMVCDHGNKISAGAKYKLECLIENNYDSGYFNSNARTIRNIFEETEKRQSHRLSKLDNCTKDQMTEFIDKDIPNNLK